MNQYLKFFLVVMLAVGLSACGSAARKSQAVNQPTTGADNVSANLSTKETTDTATEQKEEVEDKPEELASLNYEIAPLQPEIDDNPDKLLGVNGQQLIAILGDPSLVRHESPAEIWQYSSKSCVLDLVLYDSKTTYIEARDDQVRPMNSRTCLRSLLLSRKTW